MLLPNQTALRTCKNPTFTNYRVYIAEMALEVDVCVKSTASQCPNPFDVSKKMYLLVAMKKGVGMY
jgi:hypothetical protein